MCFNFIQKQRFKVRNRKHLKRTFSLKSKNVIISYTKYYHVLSESTNIKLELGIFLKEIIMTAAKS